MKRIYRSLLLAVFIAEAFVPAALAQAQQDPQDEEGPGRGVARISLLNGDVSVQRGDSGDWVAAALNAPLLADDRILSGPNSHSEVQLDYYDRIRLGGDTEIRFPELDWHKYQVQVAHGTVIFSALPGTNDQIEFATPTGSLRPLAPGSYRMTVRDDGSVEFTVRRGEAEIFTPQGTRKLTPGRTMRLHLSPDNVAEFQMAYETPRDGFDEFSDRRDQELQHSKSYQYVPRDIEGAEDLDGAGEWVDQPPYGMSWRPYVAPGWAPYREGQWVWADDDYGWTWVSYDPWGWAPYHYGSWFCNGGVWFWYPGAFGGHHYWRPGLVAFFGFGGRGGWGYGGFGWVPLAPHERYHPWYGHHGSGAYGHNADNVNIRNTYRNARVGNGVSGMDAREFGQGSGARSRPVTARELGSASVMHGALPISPSRNSLRMSDRPVNGALVARGAQFSGARFVSSRPAPSPNRTVFGSPSQSMQAAVRGTGNGGFSRAGAPQNNAARSSGSATQGGWTRMGGGAGAGNGRGSAPTTSSAGPARGGWSSFGTPAGGRSATGDAAPARGIAGSSSTAQRGGWTSFGSPVRAPSGGQPSRGAWNTGGSTNGWNGYGRGEAPSRAPSSGAGGWSSGSGQPSRGDWNTGGSSYGRSEAPYRGSTSGSGGWSSRSGPAPAYSAPSRNYSPAYSAPSRSSAPRYSAPSGGYSHRSAPAPSRSGGGGGGGGSHSSGGGGSHSGGGGGRGPRR